MFLLGIFCVERFNHEIFKIFDPYQAHISDIYQRRENQRLAYMIMKLRHTYTTINEFYRYIIFTKRYQKYDEIITSYFLSFTSLSGIRKGELTTIWHAL